MLHPTRTIWHATKDCWICLRACWDRMGSSSFAVGQIIKSDVQVSWVQRLGGQCFAALQGHALNPPFSTSSVPRQSKAEPRNQPCSSIESPLHPLHCRHILNACSSLRSHPAQSHAVGCPSSIIGIIVSDVGIIQTVCKLTTILNRQAACTYH